MFPTRSKNDNNKRRPLSLILWRKSWCQVCSWQHLMHLEKTQWPEGES